MSVVFIILFLKVVLLSNDNDVGHLWPNSQNGQDAIQSFLHRIQHQFGVKRKENGREKGRSGRGRDGTADSKME